MGEMRNLYEILIGKSESVSPLERLRHRRKDHITMGLGEVG